MAENYSRKNIIAKAEPLVPAFENAFDSIKYTNTEFKVYYCAHVQNLVKILRNFGPTKDIGLQHDLLKYLFGTLIFNDRVQFEKKEAGK